MEDLKIKSKLIKPLKKIYGSEEAIIEKSYSHTEIDKEYLMKFGNRVRGSVRIHGGLFYSKEEKEKWRTRVLNSKMP